jgi:hypothetical protein
MSGCAAKSPDDHPALLHERSPGGYLGVLRSLSGNDRRRLTDELIHGSEAIRTSQRGTLRRCRWGGGRVIRGFGRSALSFSDRSATLPLARLGSDSPYELNGLGRIAKKTTHCQLMKGLGGLLDDLKCESESVGV